MMKIVWNSMCIGVSSMENSIFSSNDNVMC